VRAALALRALAALLVGVAGCGLLTAEPASAQADADRRLGLSSLRSGLEFAGADVRALQRDPDANPLALWLARGRQLWGEPAGTPGRSCASCHGELATMKGAALRHPRLHPDSGRLVNLEDRIRECRATRQGVPAPDFESQELLALTLAVTEPSAGLPLDTAIDAALRPHWQAGRALFEQRQGQLNLACASCHDERWGQRLYTDPLSQGHPNGYPLYRLEWQAPGSLERRLRSCQAALRAVLPAWGALEQRQLALYLKWRAQGLPVEVPAVRK